MTADLLDWPSLAADDFPFPEDIPATWLAGELSSMLIAPDPRIRDDYAYTAAARWIRQGHLDAVLDALGDTAASRFDHQEIQARTFAPLILRAVLERGSNTRGCVTQVSAERWYAAFSAWFSTEEDTRGWDESRGWLHAVAHGADAAAAFASFLPDRGADVLELCARRMTATSAFRYTQLEDARLARAVTRILQAP
ncbi:DUF2785 domain-containing protein, partial [Streptomyces sp. NPDC004596]